MDELPEERGAIRDFLVTRRGRLAPGQVGLPDTGRRRVPGLRREEVAVLAGVSTEWYTRLEKGHIGGVSEEVLEAVAGALRLNHDERAYLFDLARSARSGRRRLSRPTVGQVERELQWMLDSITLSSAFVRTGRTEIVSANALARALFAPLYASDTVEASDRPNIARYVFLDSSAERFFIDWPAACSATAALLRAEAAREPGDRRLRELVGELATTSPAFRAHWAAHDVLARHDGRKRIDHPDVGLLELTFQSSSLPRSGTDRRDLVLYTAEPGSASEDRMKILAIAAATHPETAPASHRDPARSPESGIAQG